MRGSFSFCSNWKGVFCSWHVGLWININQCTDYRTKSFKLLAVTFNLEKNPWPHNVALAPEVIEAAVCLGEVGDLPHVVCNASSPFIAAQRVGAIPQGYWLVQAVQWTVVQDQSVCGNVALQRLPIDHSDCFSAVWKCELNKKGLEL